MSNPIVINPAEVVALDERRFCHLCGERATRINGDGDPTCDDCTATDLVERMSRGEVAMSVALGEISMQEAESIALNGLHKAEVRRAISNQETLGNGCVCDSGCDSCARLADEVERLRRLANPLGDSATAFYAIEQTERAQRLAAMWESWEAMRSTLKESKRRMESWGKSTYEIQAALRLAERVKERKP